jgi:hypothetical protein
VSLWMREFFVERPVTTSHILRALCHPFILALLVGLLVTLHRRSWFLLLMYLTVFVVISSPRQLSRWRKLLTAMVLLATLLVCFLLVAAELREMRGPVGRIFTTGTYTGGRLTHWGEFFDDVVANPHMLLIGGGIGSDSATAAKFGVGARGSRILHHNYLFTMIEDGGLILAVLWIIPLVIAVRSLRWASPRSSVSTEIAYTSSVLLAAVLVGGFLSNSAELTLYWSGIGLALSDKRREPEPST